MSNFSFLHTADIHLGSPLGGLSRMGEDVRATFASALTDAFERLVDEALAREVDFVLIAGDLYDGEWKDVRAGTFFARQASRLGRAGIPVFLIKGNHDAGSVVTDAVTLPDNVHVFEAKASTVTLDELGVAVHGMSYEDRHVPHSLVPLYPEPRRGVFNIGMLHTSLSGTSDHAPYAPCDPQQLAAKGYDYWALGHIHKREVVAEHPHIVFPGNLQGRSVRETGERSATLVLVENGRVERLETLACDGPRFEVLDVAADGVETLTQLAERAGRAAADRHAAHGDRPLACRVRITGTSPIEDLLRARQDELREEIALAFDRAGDAIHLERLRIATETLRAPALSADLVAGLDLHVSLANAAADGAVRERLLGELSEVLDRMPPDMRDHVDDDLLDDALRDAVSLVHSRVGGE